MSDPALEGLCLGLAGKHNQLVKARLADDCHVWVAAFSVVNDDGIRFVLIQPCYGVTAIQDTQHPANVHGHKPRLAVNLDHPARRFA